jgi:hypothetical protein
MSLPFYHFEIERTYFSDDTFGAIGRALTFATDFEANCKSLSMLMNIKSRKFSLENENDFKSFLEKLERKTLFKHIETIEQYFKIGDINSLIMNGKNARNFIAHELTLGIKESVEKDEGRKYIFESLKEKIAEIAKANIIIILLMSLETNDIIPTSDYIKKYISMILTWVLEVEE